MSFIHACIELFEFNMYMYHLICASFSVFICWIIIDFCAWVTQFAHTLEYNDTVCMCGGVCVRAGQCIICSLFIVSIIKFMKSIFAVPSISYNNEAIDHWGNVEIQIGVAFMRRN